MGPTPLTYIDIDINIDIEPAGVLRSTEQWSHQGSQPVRVGPAQAHDSARLGEALRLLREHHHQQDPVW